MILGYIPLGGGLTSSEGMFASFPEDLVWTESKSPFKVRYLS